MKKPKLNLSGDAIKQMFINHAEKIGLGAAVVVLGVLVIAAIKRESLSSDKAPEKLASLADNASKAIEATDPAGIPVPPYTPPTGKELEPLSPTDEARLAKLAEIVPFSQPVKEQRAKRSAVAILPVTELRTFADRAAIPMRKAGQPFGPGGPAGPVPPGGGPKPGDVQGLPGTERPAGAPSLLGQPPRPAVMPLPTGNFTVQGRRFVMVTGLIPVLKQQAAFDAVFKDALQPEAADDLLTGNAAGAGAAAAGANANNVDRFHPQYWWYAVQRREVLADGTFGKETVFDYKAMLQDKAQGWAQVGPEIIDQDYLDPRLTFALPPMLLKNWDDRAGHVPEIPLRIEKPAMLPAAGAGDAAMNGGEGAFDPDPLVGAAGAKKPLTQVVEKVVPHRLFRIWDYNNIEPDKSYQYRVQLIVKNPNYQLHQKILENPKLAEDQNLTSEWSAWSPTATVPRDHQLFASSIEFDKNSKEPIAKVVCWSWDHTNAVEVHQKFDMLRGEYAGDPVKFKVSLDVPNPAGGANLTLKDFVFKPNMLLVDFSGGVQGLKVPSVIPTADMLFLDAATQQLVMRRQAIDAAKLAVLDLQKMEGGAGPGAVGGAGGLGFPGEIPFPLPGKGAEKGTGPLSLPPPDILNKGAPPKSPKGK